MFHEALHGYLAKERYDNPSTFNIQFPGIVDINISGTVKFTVNHSKYASLLTSLSNAIRSFNPMLNPSEALAHAKGGVVTNLSSIEKSINYAHKKGNAGTTCK